MATFEEIKQQLNKVNKIGKENLSKKGVPLAWNESTYEIMRKIAEIPAGDKKEVALSERITENKITTFYPNENEVYSSVTIDVDIPKNSATYYSYFKGSFDPVEIQDPDSSETIKGFKSQKKMPPLDNGIYWVITNNVGKEVSILQEAENTYMLVEDGSSSIFTMAVIEEETYIVPMSQEEPFPIITGCEITKKYTGMEDCAVFSYGKYREEKSINDENILIYLTNGFSLSPIQMKIIAYSLKGLIIEEESYKIDVGRMEGMDNYIRIYLASKNSISLKKYFESENKENYSKIDIIFSQTKNNEESIRKEITNSPKIGTHFEESLYSWGNTKIFNVGL